MVKPTKPLPAFYVACWIIIQDVAREHGYCAALHGSLARDMDVIAIPWTNEAADVEVMIRAVLDRLGAHIITEKYPALLELPDYQDPAIKPHGRLAWSLHLDHGAYIDISVMPKQGELK